MASWLFTIVDTAHDTAMVVGDGDTVEDADTDARAKWDTAISGRDDYSDRAPIISCSAGPATDNDPPTLIL